MRIEDWAIHPNHVWIRGELPEQLVGYDETLEMWNIYGYPEAVEALTSPQVFSNDTGRVYPEEIDQEVCAGDFSLMDPPAHRKYRGLVDYAFHPKLITDLEPKVDAIVHEMLDELAERPGFDLVADFADPLPLTVACELLGVPREDRAFFHRWMQRMMEGAEEFVPPEVMREQQSELQQAFDLLHEAREYWLGLAEERKRRPREDLLTHLVSVEVDGERLADTEVFNIANRLLIAGHHSTALLIANTVLILDAFPAEAERVRADPALLPSAIEESLRFYTPLHGVGKVTNVDVEIGGTTIPKDQVVMVWNGAANHDPRQFPNPNVFDASRTPNPHLAFSRGVHFCIGRRLARMEARAAVRILMDRFPKLRPDPDNPPEFYQIADAGGVAKLPVLTG